jgi:hypothetical protein
MHTRLSQFSYSYIICAAPGKPDIKHLLAAVPQELPICETRSREVHFAVLVKHSHKAGARGLGSGFRNIEPSPKPYQASSKARLGSGFQGSAAGAWGLWAGPCTSLHKILVVKCVRSYPGQFSTIFHLPGTEINGSIGGTLGIWSNQHFHKKAGWNWF